MRKTGTKNGPKNTKKSKSQLWINAGQCVSNASQPRFSAIKSRSTWVWAMMSHELAIESGFESDGSNNDVSDDIMMASISR